MRLISAFTSDTDKASWRLALPMIFSNITVKAARAGGHCRTASTARSIWVAWRTSAVATSFLFSAAAVPAHEHHRSLCGAGAGSEEPGAGARLYATAAAGVVGRGAIVLLRYPLIELALRIVGGDGEVLEQARRFLRSAG